MNFLAHAYLSFGNRQILVGNMISDFVKGAQKNSFDLDVRQGIVLHRAIDTFTDDHRATVAAKQIFRPVYRLYSGAIMDIVYDHFLARDTGVFQTEAHLLAFTQQTYQTLQAHLPLLPFRFAQMLPFMVQDNWLYDYRTEAGVQKSLQRMVRRAAYLSDSAPAFQLLMNHYEMLEQAYHIFFPELKSFTKAKMQELGY